MDKFLITLLMAFLALAAHASKSLNQAGVRVSKSGTVPVLSVNSPDDSEGPLFTRESSDDDEGYDALPSEIALNGTNSTFYQDSDVEPLNRTVLDIASTDGRCILKDGSELKCPTGSCCSAFGWCTFDKSSCPSTYGPNVRMAADGICIPGKIMCPMNSCCSKWGYCGFSEMHCSAKYDCQENCQESPVPGLVRIGNHTEYPLDQQIMHATPYFKDASAPYTAESDSEYEPANQIPTNSQAMAYPDAGDAKKHGFHVDPHMEQKESNSFESSAPIDVIPYRRTEPYSSAIDVDLQEIESSQVEEPMRKDEVAYDIDDYGLSPVRKDMENAADPSMLNEKFACGTKGCFKPTEGNVEHALDTEADTIVAVPLTVASAHNVTQDRAHACKGCTASKLGRPVTYTLSGRPPIAMDWAPEIKKCKKRGVVAFVFEGGPDINTPVLLDILKTHNATATFLVHPSALMDPVSAKIIKRAVREGHQIGMSFYSQKSENAETLTKDIEGSTKQFKMVLGDVYPSYVQVKRSFMSRLPFSRSESTLRREFGLRGLKLVDPEIKIDDLSPKNANNPERVSNLIRKATRFPLPFLSSYMIQLHDGSKSTIMQMNATLDYVTRKGLRVESVADCVNDGPSAYYINLDN